MTRSFTVWLRTAAFVFLALIGAVGEARAQLPVKSFDQLPTRLRIGDTVFVADGTGREVKGKVSDLSSSALMLRTRSGPRSLPAETVKTIRWERPDSLKHGALIGLGIGAGLGLIVTAGGCGDEAGCDWRGALFIVGIFGGTGAGIGTGVDALIPGRRVLVYSASSAASTSRISVSPLLTPRRQGIAVRVRF